MAITDDSIVEDHETFTAVLSTATALGTRSTVMTDTGTGTINNNDNASVTISAPTITETDANFNMDFTVTLDTAVEGGFSLAFSDALGTAEANDYIVLTSGLSFVGNAGETQKITITIIGDDVVEDHETFTITLGDVTGTTAVQDAAITTGDSAEATIQNDDTATLWVNDIKQVETDPHQGDGSSKFVFTVTLTRAIENGVSIAIATSDDTALPGDSDYVFASTILDFAGYLNE